jgi:hypothetical protein
MLKLYMSPSLEYSLGVGSRNEIRKGYRNWRMQAVQAKREQQARIFETWAAAETSATLTGHQ